MKHTFIYTLGAVTLLGACGGGGGGGTPGDQLTPPSFASAQAVVTEGAAALDRVEALGATTPADFQRTGTAVFEGTVVINDNAAGAANASVLGGLAVEVDFADADNVTGVAGNFRDLANTVVGGTLTLDDVEFSEGTAGGGFVADLDGRLTNVGRTGADNDYDYDTDAVALYYGDGVGALLTLLSGTATQVGSSTPIDVSGAATLERQ